ncbi:MAG: ATP-binding protein [Acidobacteriota bacterium]
MQADSKEFPELRDRAYLDLAHRSVPGIPFYPLLMLLVVGLSDYAPGETPVLGALFTTSLAAAFLRFRVCRRAAEGVKLRRARWYREFALASLFQAFSWSAFVLVGLALAPSITSADSFVLLLCTAGIASGVPSSLAIDQRLAPLFLGVLLLPPLPMLIREGSPQAFALVFFLALFCGYLTLIARRLGVDHSQLASQAILLEARADQLRREVKEREAAEALALQSRRRFRDLVQQAPVGILELDRDGLVVESNVVGRSLLEVVGGRPNESLWQALGLVAAPAGSGEGELVFRVGRSKDRWMALSHVPFEDLSIGGGSIVVLVDNTDQQQAEIDIRRAKEEAETASRMKSEFLANMSHELRTPMNGIVGVADMLTEVDDPESQEEIVGLLKSSTLSLLSVVERILDFAAIDSDEGSSEPFGVAAVLEQVVASRRESASAAGLQLEMHVASGVPDVVEGDGLAVGRVLERLLENAIGYTEEGRVDVRVEKVADRGGMVELCFEVVDSGVGVPESAREAIFRPFEQADGSMTRSRDGVGLGLAIAARLVQRMGGQLEIESEVGEGSRFFWTSAFDRLDAEDPEVLETATMDAEVASPSTPA